MYFILLYNGRIVIKLGHGVKENEDGFRIFAIMPEGNDKKSECQLSTVVYFVLGLRKEMNHLIIYINFLINALLIFLLHAEKYRSLSKPLLIISLIFK